jgi:hypothetical protein
MNCTEADVMVAHDAIRPDRSLLGWIPFLWSKFLFAGETPASEPVKPTARLLLLLVPGVLLYSCLSFPLFEPDEGRYAEIPREMLARGEWTVPYLQGQPYLDKPPLLYWLVMLSYRTFGLHDWSARLVPALALHGCILLTYFFGRRLVGDRPAFWGALILAVAPGFVSIGRFLILDSLLSLWVCLSLFAGFEAVRGDRLRWSWWFVSALACGIGILTKGPVALLLLVPPLWAYQGLTGTGARVGVLSALGFVAPTLAVALPWYFAIYLRLPTFGYYFIWEHNFIRFFGSFNHLRPVWFYAPVLFLGLFPITLLLIPFFRFLTSGDEAVRQRRPPELGFVLLAGGWCVFFFTVSSCKLPTYIMPALPFLALAFGYFIVHQRWQARLLPQGLALSGFALLFAVHHVVLPWYAGQRAPLARVPELQCYFQEPETPILCYPSDCDSVSFYVERDDLRSYRSKETHLLVGFMQKHARSVVVFTHRHALEGLRHALTPDLRLVEEKHFGLRRVSFLPDALAQTLTWLMGETSLGLCDVAVVERLRKDEPR